jgi:hypothetical protein
MKLLGYNISGDTNQTLGQDVFMWENTVLDGNNAFIVIEDNGTIPNNYTDITSIISWENYGKFAGLSSRDIKREIKKLRPEDTSALTDEELGILESYSILSDRFYREKEFSETSTNSSLTSYDTLTFEIDSSGTYDLQVTFLCSMNSTSKSFHYNVFIDGVPIYGLTPLSMEMKDTTNEHVVNLNRDITLSEGTHTIQLLYASEKKATASIYYSNIILNKID